MHSRRPLGQWRQGKLTHQDVRRELIESCQRVDQGLAEVAAVEAAEAGMRAEACAAAFAKTLKLSLFKEASPQERSWLAQYAGGVASHAALSAGLKTSETKVGLARRPFSSGLKLQRQGWDPEATFLFGRKTSGTKVGPRSGPLRS